jgi:hypothetical protein
VTDQTADQSAIVRESVWMAAPRAIAGNTDDSPPVAIGSEPVEPGFVVVTHNGREYLATKEMAEIFQRQAQRIINRRASELVVLAHASGVELLPITSITPFSVSTRQQGSQVPGGQFPHGQPRTRLTAHKRRGTPLGTPRGRRVAAGTAAASGTAPDTPVTPRKAAWARSGVPDRTAMANVPLRVVGPGHQITTLQTLVVYIGDSTFEIQLDGQVIGFIRRAGRTFAALAGPDIPASANWGHWNLWDSAATFLVHAAALAPAKASVHVAM